MDTYFIVDASHLFRAGDLYASQIYVIDVVNYLCQNVFNCTMKDTWVLFGSTKDSQSKSYTQAVEKTGIHVVRMVPIDSRVHPGSKFYKPSMYLHPLFEVIPKGSQVIFIGFHNTRFEDLFRSYTKDYHLSLCAFTTKSRSNHDMAIPEKFHQILERTICLDNHIDGIKALYAQTREASHE